jgi:3-hydroxyacyl-[acyl-carrier-protein] dehydratase
MMDISSDELTEWLPHRPPILLPECISVIEPGQAGLGKVFLDSATRIWNDETHEDFAQALILESAAQILGVVLATQPSSTNKADGVHLLLGFDDVTFGEKPSLAQDFEVTVELERSLGKMHRARFFATQCGRSLAAGRVSVMKG